MHEFDLNMFFQTQLKFGSTQQPINLIIDTGSSWTWTLIDECEQSDCLDVDDYFYSPFLEFYQRDAQFMQ